jgi:hypothetical protein
MAGKKKAVGISFEDMGTLETCVYCPTETGKVDSETKERVCARHEEYHAERRGGTVASDASGEEEKVEKVKEEEDDGANN